jgi:hypothetical protein
MLAKPRELTYLEYTFAPKDLKEGSSAFGELRARPSASEEAP